MKYIVLLMICMGLISSCQSPSSSASSTTVTYAAITGSDPQAESMTGFTDTVSSVTYRAIVNRFTRAVTLYLPSGTAVTALTPTVTLASDVTIASPSTTTNDFTSPVTYTLSDGSTYTVTVNTSGAPSAATVNGWIGQGINLGNDLDAWPGAEGSWTSGVVASEAFFNDYKKLGFNSVRIPITWGEATVASDRLDSVSPYNVNSTFMSRVDQVASWAIDAGLTVIINTHHENWIRTLTGSAVTAQMPRFEALWTQIATHFQGWPPQLVFEILNEPQGSMTNTDLKTLNQTILTSYIRPTNPTRVVIVGADSYNSISELDGGTFVVPTDPSAVSGVPYLIATFHNYNPYDFAGNSKGTWGTSSDIASIKSDFDKVATWGTTNKVPIYMGEYGVKIHTTTNGVTLTTDTTSRITWYTQVVKLAKADNISMTAWDDYGDFKLYGRSNDTFETDLNGIVNP